MGMNLLKLPLLYKNQVILSLNKTFIFDPRNYKQFKKLVSQLFPHIAP